MTIPNLKPAKIGLLPTADFARHSGLEFLAGLIAGDIPHPPMSETGNYRVCEASRGKVVVEGAPEQTHLNPQGTTHGGWFGTILDTAMGCAVMSILDKGSIYTTLEYKVNLIRGLPPGTHVLALGESRHSGRTTAVSTAELRGAADGRLYATASTTCLIMRARA